MRSRLIIFAIERTSKGFSIYKGMGGWQKI